MNYIGVTEIDIAKLTMGEREKNKENEKPWFAGQVHRPVAFKAAARRRYSHHQKMTHTCNIYNKITPINTLIHSNNWQQYLKYVYQFVAICTVH